MTGASDLRAQGAPLSRLEGRPGRGRLDCLAGYVVLDLTQYYAGPFGTHLLSSLGATLIKVEPLEGEFLRLGNPVVGRDGPQLNPGTPDAETMALRFMKWNGGKLGVSIDLKTDQGQEVLRRLIASSDAFIHNFRAATARGLHVTAADVLAVNPHIVYCAVDGLGPDYGADDLRPVIDYAAQALTGAMNFPEGDPDASPRALGTALGDASGGLFGAIAVIAGLLRRDGRRAGADDNSFSVSMLGGLSNFVWDRALDVVAESGPIPGTARNTLQNPTVPPWVGLVFATSDKRWLYITGIGQDQWRRLVAATGIKEFEEYEQLADAMVEGKRIEALLVAWVLRFSQEEALARFAAHGVAAWPVRRPADVMADERFVDTFLYEVNHPTYGPTGWHRAVCPIVPDDDSLYAWDDAPAPLVGQHTAQVLEAYAGMTSDQIQALVAAGVIRCTSVKSDATRNDDDRAS